MHPSPSSESALVAKIHVVDGASLRFTETGQSREDTYEIEWEATPPPAARTTPPEPVLRPPAAPQRPRLSHGLETMPGVFDGLDAAVLQRDIDQFDIIDTFEGETLISEGEHHPALVMVLRGSLRAIRGTERRRVLSGEVLGLTTLFGSGVWPTTVITESECRLMVLELDGYQALRDRSSPVSLTLEEWALAAFLDGLHRTAKAVAEHVRAEPLANLVPSKGFLARFAAAFGAGGIQDARVDVMGALQGSPMFRNAVPEDIAALVSHFHGVRVRAGEFLITEGQPSTQLYQIVSGSVDVLTVVGEAKAIRHETLGPGQLFGAWSMLRPTPGWASFVAMEPAVLLELSKLSWAEVAPSRDASGSILRLALLRSLCQRLITTAAHLTALRGGLAPATMEHSKFVTINPATRR